MKKILSINDIAKLYFETHDEKCVDLWLAWWNWTLKTFNPDTLHFRKFKIKHLFLNQWKKFLNWSEKTIVRKLFPELSEPRFEKKPLWWIVKPEAKEIKKFKYMQRVRFHDWFFEWLEGVILWNHCFFWGKYEVQIIIKWEEKIVEAWWSDMTIIEDKEKPSKS